MTPLLLPVAHDDGIADLERRQGRAIATSWINKSAPVLSLHDIAAVTRVAGNHRNKPMIILYHWL